MNADSCKTSTASKISTVVEKVISGIFYGRLVFDAKIGMQYTIVKKKKATVQIFIMETRLTFSIFTLCSAIDPLCSESEVERQSTWGIFFRRVTLMYIREARNERSHRNFPSSLGDFAKPREPRKARVSDRRFGTFLRRKPKIFDASL